MPAKLLCGSKGYAGLTGPQLVFKPLALTPQMFHSVQRDCDMAPGMPEVSAWRK